MSSLCPPTNNEGSASDSTSTGSKKRKRTRHARSDNSKAKRKASYIARAQELGLGDNEIQVLAELPTEFVTRPTSGDAARDKMEALLPDHRAVSDNFPSAPADGDWIYRLAPEAEIPPGWVNNSCPVFRIDKGFPTHTLDVALDLIHSFYSTNPQPQAAHRNAASRSAYPGFHLGVWRQSSPVPRFTADARMQEPRVRPWMEALMKGMDQLVGKRVVRLLANHYAEVAEERASILAHTYSHPALQQDLHDHPAWKQQAWHCLVIRHGAANIEHLDFGDDPDQFTILFVFGNFVGADLIIPQLKIRIPLRPGQILFLRTRYLLHYATSFTGTRFVFTGFMDSVLCNDYRKWKKAEEEAREAEKSEAA